MKFEDIVTLLIPISFFVLLATEALWPARAYSKKKLWRLAGTGFLFVMAAIAALLPLALPAEWVGRHRLMDLSSLGIAGGAVVGYLGTSFVSFLWHRAAHRFDFLWRTFHQMHHAPARMDMGGSAVFHPLEVAVFVLLSTVMSSLVLGLSAEAAALTGFIAQFYSFFQHWNVKTPQWLGYFIQRPEAHFVHHQRDVHAYNYSDLPIWDMLVGSYRNPKDYGTEEVGFAAPNDGRYLAMLAGQDVSETVGTRVQRDVTSMSRSTESPHPIS